MKRPIDPTARALAVEEFWRRMLRILGYAAGILLLLVTWGFFALLGSTP